MATNYNTSIFTGGVPYMSAYDPSNDARYLDLMREESAKASAAHAGTMQAEAQIGDFASLDLEGKAQVLGNFKDRLAKVRELYNNDLALAAPALAREVAAERQNPWYAKSAAYSQQYERRQKAFDMFGPNVIVTKDLPVGKNLNEIDMQDITFDYVNRAHLHELYKEMYGHLGNVLNEGSWRSIGNGLLEKDVYKGQSEEAIQALTQGEEYSKYLDDLLTSYEGQGIRGVKKDMLAGEFDRWARTNLAQSKTTETREDPNADKNPFPTGLVPTALRTRQTFTETTQRTDKDVRSIVTTPDADLTPEDIAIKEGLRQNHPEQFKTFEESVNNVKTTLYNTIPGINKLETPIKLQILDKIYKALDNPAIHSSAIYETALALLFDAGVEGITRKEHSSPAGYMSGINTFYTYSLDAGNEKSLKKTIRDAKKAYDKSYSDLKSSFNSLNTITAISEDSYINEDKLKAVYTNLRSHLGTDEELYKKFSYFDPKKDNTGTSRDMSAKAHSKFYEKMKTAKDTDLESVIFRPSTKAESPNMLEYQFKDGDVFRIAPNSADADRFWMNFSVDTDDPIPYLKHEDSKYMKQFNNNNGKLSINDLAPSIPNGKDFYIKEKDGQYVFYENDTPKMSFETLGEGVTNGLAPLIAAATGRDYFDYNKMEFLSKLIAKRATPKEQIDYLRSLYNQNMISAMEFNYFLNQ